MRDGTRDLDEFEVWLAGRSYSAKTRTIYVGVARRAQRWATVECDASLLQLELGDLQRFSAALPSQWARAQARVALIAFYRAHGRPHGDPASALGAPRSMTPRRVGARSSAGERQLEAWMIERRYAPKTRSAYLGHVRRCRAWLTDALGVELVDASGDELHAWWSTLPGANGTTRNQARTALVAFFRAHGRRHGEPADELPGLPRPHGLPRPFVDDDYRTLIDTAVALGGRHEVVGLMLAYTGCRFSEMRTARWDQFTFSSSGAAWFIEGKGSKRRGAKERLVPLHPELTSVLTAWRTKCGSALHLFPSPRSITAQPISDPGLREVVNEIAQVAGLDGVTPHRFRHTVATTALARTNDLRGVQELLGHADLSTTQIYTKVAPGRLEALVGALTDATHG